MGNLENAVSRTPLSIPAIAFAFGIILQNRDLANLTGALILLVLAFLLCYILISLSSEPLRSFRIRKYHYLWLAMAFTALGAIIANHNKPDSIPSRFIGPSTLIHAHVVEIAYRSDSEAVTLNIQRLTSDDGHTSSFRKFKSKIFLPTSQLKIDDNIVLSGTLTPVDNSPNNFNSKYKSLQNQRGFFYTIQPSSQNIRIISNTPTFHGFILKLRYACETIIERAGFSTPTANFLITILLGDKEYLDNETRNLFAGAGIAHILALSGMHVGILASILIIILFPLNIFGKYKLRILLTIILLWFYTLITGAAPSTLRAAIMFSLCGTALLLERKVNVFNSLFAAAILILALDPSSLTDIGFQLSFLCVFSLAAFSIHLNPFSRESSFRLHSLAAIIVTTIIATFSSWIISAFFFGCIPTAFLPANILCVPLLPFYIALALLQILLSAVGMPIPTLASLLDTIYEAFRQFVSVLQTGTTVFTHIPSLAVALWIAGLTLMAIFFNINRRKIYPAASASLFILSFSLILCPTLNPFYNPANLPPPPESFILNPDISAIPITIKTTDGEEILNLPRYTISETTIGNKRIASFDSDFDPTLQIQNSPHFLIIASGYGGKAEPLIRKLSPKTIILHSTLRHFQRIRLAAELDSLKCPYLQLSENSPIRIINQPISKY